MTPDELETASKARAKRNQRRITMLAVVTLFVLFGFAGILQRQQLDLSGYVHQMCLQRQDEVIKTNANWEGLAKIEQHNRFIDAQIRNERLAMYHGAELTVPDCT